MARLLSSIVGAAARRHGTAITVHTAVWNTPVQGQRMVRRLNIDGDGQGDLAGHGGEHRAVFVYQIKSYRYWQNELGRNDFVHGQFGENFTVEGLSDGEVCIGDRYRVGGALFEVTQPRVTCYRVGIRTNEPRMPCAVGGARQGGPVFISRVLGWRARSRPATTSCSRFAEGPAAHRACSRSMRSCIRQVMPRDQLQRALRIPALSGGWRHSFQALLDEADSLPGRH